jgi:putative transposase
MARLGRIAIVNVPHHVTQRGNARQFLLASDEERLVYLELLRRYVRLHQLSLLGYCLMCNHVHLIVVPQRAESLALALKNTHGRYASYWNAAHQSSGHVWQGRFYSCPLDDAHLWIALRYTERNPVRAGLVRQLEAWEWSSAGAHCGDGDADPCLNMQAWARRWSSTAWREYLGCGENDAELCAIRKNTHTGHPLGSGEFVRSLEEATARRLEPQKGGRPRLPAQHREQTELAFE